MGSKIWGATRRDATVPNPNGAAGVAVEARRVVTRQSEGGRELLSGSETR
jgi:hypothetical protein